MIQATQIAWRHKHRTSTQTTPAIPRYTGRAALAPPPAPNRVTSGYGQNAFIEDEVRPFAKSAKSITLRPTPRCPRNWSVHLTETSRPVLRLHHGPPPGHIRRVGRWLSKDLHDAGGSRPRSARYGAARLHIMHRSPASRMPAHAAAGALRFESEHACSPRSGLFIGDEAGPASARKAPR